MNSSVVLLAGGFGNRMESSVPKQYLNIHGTPIAQYSFEVFEECSFVSEIIVVCDPTYHPLFRSMLSSSSQKVLKFALPGERRQDSLASGIAELSPDCEWVVVHDAARPCIDKELVTRVLEKATERGAATAAVQVKATIKECDGERRVIRTPDRAFLWEIQTPQIARPSLLRQGLSKAREEGETVTDDMGLVELMGADAFVAEGCYRNIKVTTPEDLELVKILLQKAEV